MNALVIRHVLDLQGAAIREQLIALGWTPPDASSERVSLRNAADDIDSALAQNAQGDGMRARIGCDSESEWFVELVGVSLHTVRTAKVFDTREKAEAYLKGINLWLEGGDSPLPVERARVPDGWVLVPREPTDEMLTAYEFDCGAVQSMRRSGYVWGAMLAARPSQPTDAQDARNALIRGRSQDEEPRVRHICSMGVGCEEAGVCYAEAHGQPDQCGNPATQPKDAAQ